MQNLSPYLIFDGNAKDAFDFYKSVFGGQFSVIMKASDAPEQGDNKLDPAEREKLIHICLPLSTGQMLKGSDMIQSFCSGNTNDLIKGTNQFISVQADNENEARSLFQKLSKRASIQTEIQPMFWGDLFGQLTDQFGIQWMVYAQLEKA